MTKSLRILIIRNAYQQDAGGAEQYALNLAIALKKSGHKPVLVTKVRNILDKAHSAHIKTVVGKWHDKQGWDRWYYLRYPIYTAWYMYLILRYRIDAVHVQSRDDFVFATRAAWFLNKPIVWTDHADLKYVLDNIKHYNPRMRSWVIHAANVATAIMASSQNERKEILAVAPEMPPIKVVYNGAFIDRGLEPVARTNKLVVGTNSRLVSSKGIAELIQGVAALKRDDVDLWLLGGVSGNLKKYQNMVKRFGIQKRVKFWDYVAKPNNVVASMDVFVHPSYHEAFSLAVVEAAMLGKAIVATNTGGTPEIIDDSCGILIPIKDPEAITTALNALIDYPAKRQELGRAAHNKAVRDFDFQKIVDNKITPLYRKG